MHILRFAAAALLVTGFAAAAAAEKDPVRTYIVRMRDAPVATFGADGSSVSGMAATAVAEGSRLDADAGHVKLYRDHLVRQRASVITSLSGGAKVLQHFDLGFSGFAVRMPESKARQLQASGQVLSVRPERIVRVNTVSTPRFLGLNTPGGAWSRITPDCLLKGEGVIIAAIDSGVQPENPAFYDQVDSKGAPVARNGQLAYGPPPARWKGTCQAGPGFPRSSCNRKLIGARVFNTSFLASNVLPWFGTFHDSPRDENGHGSHTLSTAGGNANAPSVDSQGVLMGTTSGVAPRARVAAYKALFAVVGQEGEVGGGGFEGDILAAIDAAIADGVDVINFSVSGSPGSLTDSVQLAFLGAARAGIFVAAAAGNSGPDRSVDHPSPWLTTVAASTHDRNTHATLTLGSGVEFTGPSFNVNATPVLPMVLSDAIAATGVSATKARYCGPKTLDGARAAGKIVVCDRGGVITRPEKGQEVRRAGGAGMVMVNTPEADDPMVLDLQAVPSVYLPLSSRAALRAYAATGGAVGRIGAGRQQPGVVAPVLAEFSSRGPNLADASVMKPDIAAPGVSVIASAAFPQRNQAVHEAIRTGRTVVQPVGAMLDGTSMASPHVAGLAALLMQAHPAWTPAEVKSALLTTAGGVKLADGSPDTDRSGYGAGHVNVNAAIDVPLVYPIQPAEYTRFLCGWLATDAAECGSVTPIKPQDLNLPTIADEVVGVSSFKRHVRNVSGAMLTVKADATLPGFSIAVEPPTLTLAPGQAGQFKVSVATDSPPTGELVSGALVWSDGNRRITSPMQVRAVPLAAPFEMTSTAAAGNLSFPVTYGFAGLTRTQVAGFKAAGRIPIQARDNEETCVPQPLPAGTLAFRVAMYAADQNMDVPIFLSVRDDATGNEGFAEQLDGMRVATLFAPPAGRYSICVLPLLPQGTNLSAVLSTWTFTTSDAGGSLQVSGLPNGAVAKGQTYTAQARWSGLESGVRHLGMVAYGNNDGSLAGLTLLRVEPGFAETAGGAVRRGSAYGNTHPVAKRRNPK